MADFPRRSARLKQKHKSKFVKREVPQTRSPLLSLPAELRYMIYKHLVISDGPIMSAHARPPRLVEVQNTRRGTSHLHLVKEDVRPPEGATLETRILECCQMTLREIGELLYGCNDLIINVFNEGPSGHYCSTNSLVAPFALNRLSTIRKDSANREVLRKFKSIQFDLHLLPLLGQPRQYDSATRCDDTAEILETMVRDICINRYDLLHKRVSFTIPDHLRDAEGTMYGFMSQYAGIFELIRCKEISFPELDPETYSQLASIVTDSNERIVDLPQKACRAVMLCSDIVEDILPLCRAARSFNIRAFIKAGEEMLALVARIYCFKGEENDENGEHGDEAENRNDDEHEDEDGEEDEDGNGDRNRDSMDDEERDFENLISESIEEARKILKIKKSIIARYG